ncbi:hypothetical protein IQ07DRAFT_650283 [Pyrenochaeta sp. DS3sAY3a]|nr:hypothetical protein IQ07DRAFT_650283 [Pyrenochaeta sp. DS3sAY3a]
MAFNRLIRFVGEDAQVHYGDADISSVQELNTHLEKGTLQARELLGDSISRLVPSGRILRVKELLSPLEQANVPIIRCIGLNYMKHIKEGGRKPPPYPSIFIKPSPSLNTHTAPVYVPKFAIEAGPQIDYEGELCIVIGKAGKNISKERALEHIAGYCVSNDVSERRWQRDPAYAGGVPQWGFAKGFDGWCPVGPMIVSPAVVGKADALRLTTRVNGELRQDTETSDLLFNVVDIVAFASQGTTLQEGSLILTGTPSGVAMGMQTPVYLSDGDVVDVEISELGRCSNKIVFEA